MSEPSEEAGAPAGLPVDPEVGTERQPSLAAAAGVALGALVGGTARFALYQALPGGPLGFPLATLTVNVTGSFLLGLVVNALRRQGTPGWSRSFAASGVLGTLTTFSTFMVDATLLVRDGRLGMAMVYVATSLAAGLVAVWAGTRAGRLLDRQREAR